MAECVVHGRPMVRVPQVWSRAMRELWVLPLAAALTPHARRTYQMRSSLHGAIAGSVCVPDQPTSLHASTEPG